MDRHVLIVDDNAYNTKIFRAKLEHEGYKVSTALNGRDSLIFLQQTIPDIILLDLMMPGIDGMSFLKLARSRKELERVPIIVFSAKDQVEDQQKAFELGANGYLVKTKASPNDVFFKISEILGDKAPTAAPLQFHVQIRDNTLDATKVGLKAGLANELKCKTCQSRVVLEMKPYASGGPEYFLARFVCPKCSAAAKQPAINPSNDPRAVPRVKLNS